MAQPDGVDPMAIARELVLDALEARADDVRRVFHDHGNTSIAIVVHLKNGLGFEAHAFPPVQHQTQRPTIIRRRRAWSRVIDGLVSALCSDCDGGADRCATEGHLQAKGFELESTDPALAKFVCARCNQHFTIPRCASCGRMMAESA